jgi:hypothetical protein
MSTLRQYYDSDFKGFIGLVGPLKLRVNKKPIDPPVVRTVLYNHDSRAAFHAIYVPPDLPAVEVCSFILQNRDLFDGMRKALHIEVGFPGGPLDQISDCLFTGRVILYVDSDLGDGEKQALTAVAQSDGLDLILRDRSYAAMKDASENPHAFISHDWRDKEDIARPLAVSLAHNLCKVWYDEFSLNIGDSLRDKIEDGLKRCHKCIVILTPHFLANNRWAKREFDSVFTRELVEEKQLFLPIWASISREDVYHYSPMLADRVSVPWDPKNIEDVTRRLLKILL